MRFARNVKNGTSRIDPDEVRRVRERMKLFQDRINFYLKQTLHMYVKSHKNDNERDNIDCYLVSLVFEVLVGFGFVSLETDLQHAITQGVPI